MKLYLDKHKKEIEIGDIVVYKKSKAPLIVVQGNGDFLRAKALDSDVGRSFEVFPSRDFTIIKKNTL